MQRSRANVTLEIYEGPLDLLIALIHKNEIDIYDIPIVEITTQYMDYIYQLNQFNIEVASEFIVMAARLIEIKSAMLLPKAPKMDDEEDEDPRAELVRRLEAYRVYKYISLFLSQNEDNLSRSVTRDPSFDPKLIESAKPSGYQNLTLPALERAMANLLLRTNAKKESIKKVFETGDFISIEIKVEQIKLLLNFKPRITLSEVIGDTFTKNNVIASFLAILELTKVGYIYIWQEDPHSDIFASRV
jgi:segregation and condensation protein A